MKEAAKSFSPSRREIVGLAGAALICGVAAIPAPAKGAAPCPMVAAITALRKAEHDYDLQTRGVPHDFDYDAVSDRTYSPLYAALEEQTPIVTSRDGAISALRYALEQPTLSLGGAESNLVAAALVYLESGLTS